MSDTPKNPGQDPSKSMGIAAENENSMGRTPEFKAARAEFVATTNDFLQRVRALQESGGMVELAGYHFPIETTPRVQERRLGQNPLLTHLNMVQIEKKAGISLYGDGVTSPLVFSAVLPGGGNSARTIEITGTDPMLARNEDGSTAFNPGNTGNVARATFVTEIVGGEDASRVTSLSYSVRGDGAAGSPARPTQPGIDNWIRNRVEGMQEAALMVNSLAGELGIPPLAQTI